MAPQVGARSFVGATSSSRRRYCNPATSTARSRSNAASSVLDLHCDPSVGGSTQCRQSRGGGGEGASRFRRVLTACAAAGLYQTVLDEGPIISRLLQATRESGNIRTEIIPYVDRVLAGLQ